MRTLVLITLIIITFNNANAIENHEFARIQKLTEGVIAKSVICTPNTAYVCTNIKCTIITPTITIKIDFDKSLYKRCDIKGCDSYSASIVPSGIYTSLTFLGKPLLFRVLNDGSQFSETAFAGVNQYSNFGSCKVIK